MSNALERDNFDSNDTGLRDSIEASIAQHSTSPDVDSIVNGAVEERNVELRSPTSIVGVTKKSVNPKSGAATHKIGGSKRSGPHSNPLKRRLPHHREGPRPVLK